MCVLLLPLLFSACTPPSTIDGSIVPLQPETFTINIDTDTAGNTCSISPAKAKYTKGEYIKLSAQPVTGYTFNGWTGTVTGLDNPLLMTVSKNEWIIPVFKKNPDPVPEKTFTVNVNSQNGGSVTITPVKTSYAKDEFVELAAKPEPGYGFSGWSGTASGTTNPLLVTVSKNEWIIPVFTKTSAPVTTTYTVRVDTSTGGAITVLPVKSEYLPGDFVKVSATPEAGYSFSGWQGTISSSQNPLLITVSRNEWVIPEFKKDPTPTPETTYTIKIDSAIGGITSRNPNKTEYTKDETVSVSASPDPGYTFSGWTGTVTSVENPLILKMTSNNWLVPKFTKVATFKLISEWNPIGGSITSSEGSKTVFNYGDKCSLKAVPIDGYQFDGWKGDIVSADKDLYITFDKDYQVYAQFSRIPVATTYPLTISSMSNGTITCVPSKTVYYENEIVRVTAKPDSGYLFGDWTGTYANQPQTFDIKMTSPITIGSTFIKRKWTFIVYMAADNDLESFAIDDLNELENAPWKGQPVTVLALLDRASGGDQTNGDWTDTRLFEITQDPGGSNGTIISKRIDCPPLGITANTETELDMSSRSVLSNLIDFVKVPYSAENYGLVIWGHGTGWRASENPAATSIEPVKAIAIDDTSGSNKYMPLISLGMAVSGKGLNVIAFDTCYGALLEVAYELRNSASYLVASEGTVPSTGWNYSSLFNAFFASGLTASSFCDVTINQFRTQYQGVSGTQISKINLSHIPSLASSFDAFALSLAQGLTKMSSRDAVLSQILNNVRSYHAASYPCDMYIDIKSFALLMQSYPSLATLDPAQQSTIYSTATAMLSSCNTAIEQSWVQGTGDTTGMIGVNLISLTGPNVVSASHSDAYTKNTGNTEQSSFVQNSSHWVPYKIPSATSFLDKMFHWSY
jgi:hypothetical protein